MKKNKAPKTSLEINATYGQSAYGTDKVLHAVLRYLILLTAVIGMGASCSEILGMKPEAMTLILSSAYTFTVFYLLFRSLKGLIAGIAFGAVGMFTALMVLHLSLKQLFVGGFNGIFNLILDIISKRGYKTVPYLDTGIVTDFGILVIITALAALTVGISCRKRTRVIPYAVVVAIPAMIFMLTGGEVQLRYFALPVAAACAMATMELAERGVKGAFRSSFVGFTSFVLASMLMLTPMVNTDRSMKQIGAGEIIKDLIPDYNVSEVQRSAVLRRHTFTGKHIMTVHSNVASPVYLRNWAGGFYGNQSWYSVDYDYGYPFGEFARSKDYFELTKKFIELAELLGYGKDQIGIGLTDISIVLDVKQKNLPLPSMSGRIGAIYDGDKTFYPSYIYDGVSMLESAWKGEILTSAAVIDDYDNELLSDVIYGFYEYLFYGTYGMTPTSAIGKYFAGTLNKYGNGKYFLLGSNLASFANSAYGADVKDAAINRAVEEIFENTDIEQYFHGVLLSQIDAVHLYRGVVHNGCYYVLDNEGKAHALEVAKIVADYLADGRKYSTNPKSTGLSVTEELLFGSKEGYCVQFATVGTLIMRRLGFSARYAEGYIAQDFEGSKSSYAYESKITDREGHAWCEVWIEGFGWLTCEMTPGFGELNVGGTTPPPVTTPPETSDTPITTTPPVTGTTPSETTDKPIVTTPSETEKPIIDTTEPKYGDGDKTNDLDPVPFVILGVALILLIAFISSVISTVNKKKKRLDALISRALAGNNNSDERRILAEALKSALSGALGAYGALPKAGELPEGYASRLEETLRLDGLEIPISLCVSALVKQVYGFGMDENDVKVSAFTLRALRVNARKKVGLFKLIIYRIKGVL